MPRLREGDKIIIDPHEIVLEKTDAVCIHALPPLLRYAIALTEGIDAAKLGLSKNLQDNLNIHTYGSFYERFEPEAARKLCKKFEFHYTPKKASWLNMIEIEFSALSKQCLDRRIGDIEALRGEKLGQEVPYAI